MSYHTRPPQQEAGSTFTTSVREAEAKRPPASRQPLRFFPFLFFCLLSCVFERLQLLRTDYTKRPSQIIVRPGGEEELVGPAVVCRSSAEFNPPELVDNDVLAVLVL